MRIICLDAELGGPGKEFSLLSITFKVYDKIGRQPPVVVDRLRLKVKHAVYKIHPGGMAVNKIDLAKHDTDPESLTLDEIKGQTMLYKFLKKNKPKGDFLVPLGQGVRGDLEVVFENLMKEESWKSFVSVCAMDTLVVAQTFQYWGLLPQDMDLKLATLCDFFKLTGFDFHTDEGDVDATVALLEKMGEWKTKV
jgi:hypothetical protein